MALEKKQEAQACQKYIIMSPRKMRRVINQIRGKSVVSAYELLRLMPYEAAKVTLKKLVEAISNAQLKYSVDDVNQMCVSRVFVNEGPVYKRFKPRAQGRIYQRKKQTSHLTIVVEVKS